MRKLIVFLAILGLALMAVPAAHALVPVTLPASDAIQAPGDLTASNLYSGDTGSGFKIQWDISFNSAENEYEYSYFISAANGGAFPSKLQNFYLQVSDGFSIIENGELTPTGAQVGDVTAGGQTFHALYWTNLNASTLSIHFDALAAPVWGSFFADNGSLFVSGESTYAHNGDFANFLPDGDNIYDYIPVPDTVPIPPTVLLLGSGLLGLVGFRVRRQLI